MTASRNILPKYLYYTDGKGNVYRNASNKWQVRNPKTIRISWLDCNTPYCPLKEVHRTEVTTNTRLAPPRYRYFRLGCIRLVRTTSDYEDTRILYIDHNGRPCWQKVHFTNSLEALHGCSRKEAGEEIRKLRRERFSHTYEEKNHDPCNDTQV